MPATPPPSCELFSLRELAARHPNILSVNRLAWAVRNRTHNGLDAAVYETAVGELLLHEPAVIRWLLGLDGRRKPRAPRRPRRRSLQRPSARSAPA